MRGIFRSYVCTLLNSAFLLLTRIPGNGEEMYENGNLPAHHLLFELPFFHNPITYEIIVIYLTKKNNMLVFKQIVISWLFVQQFG